MAEAVAALAALGVAANIFQFLEVAGRVAKRGWKAYREPDRQIEDVFSPDAMVSLTSDLKRSLDKLQSDQSPPYRSTGTQECEIGMSRVAEDCVKVADKLLDRLNELAALRHSDRKRDILRAAMTSVWRQDEIKALEQRLEQFRSQLSMGIHFLSRSSSPEEKEWAIQTCEIQRPTVDTQMLFGALRDTLREPWAHALGPGILRFVCSGIPESESEHATRLLQRSILDAVAANGQNVISALSLDKVPQGWNKYVRYRHHGLFNKLLNNLDSDVVNERLLQVSPAHEQTFRWIFSPPREGEATPWCNFLEWLRHPESPLYWVTGKPGSGKSTLMKFILKHKTESSTPWTVLEKLLPKPSVLAASWTIVYFYAWYAGAKQQKSIHGLCRNLIFQLVDKHRTILPRVFPSCWEALWLMDDMSTDQIEQVSRLGDLNTLLEVTREIIKTDKIFFLIDGLDEVQGETEEAAELILTLASLPNVKICASSRPWPVFEEAFDHKPHLTIQDLTRPDIKSYTNDKLSQSPGFSRLQERDTEYASKLIDQVTEKSSGVFLWVILVVKSLLDGLRDDDRIVDLERRINKLPNDLDMLFTRILGDLDPFHLNHARQYFSLVALYRHYFSEDGLQAIILSFADEECPGFVSRLAVRPMTDTEISGRIRTMTRRVESVSRGLLEVVRGNSLHAAKVDYLHRTVVEYLELDVARDTLGIDAEPQKDPSLHIQLASAHLCMLKGLDTSPQAGGESFASNFPTLVRQVLRFAGRADLELPTDDHPLATQIVAVLDHLDLGARILAKSAAQVGTITEEPGMVRTIRTTLASGHWAITQENILIPSIVASKMQFSNSNSGTGRTYLSLVARHGICCYIRARAPPGCLVQRLDVRDDGQPVHTIWPLLADMLDFNSLKVDSRMLHQLLRLNADPGFEFLLPSFGTRTTPLRMAIDRWRRPFWNRSGDTPDTGQMRQVITEMFGISGLKNLPKDSQAHLRDLLKGAHETTSVKGGDSSMRRFL